MDFTKALSKLDILKKLPPIGSAHVYFTVNNFWDTPQCEPTNIYSSPSRTMYVVRYNERSANCPLRLMPTYIFATVCYGGHVKLFSRPSRNSMGRNVEVILGNLEDLVKYKTSTI